eukprot:1094597-Prorocentrum_lima.AAC.1
MVTSIRITRAIQVRACTTARITVVNVKRRPHGWPVTLVPLVPISMSSKPTERPGAGVTSWSVRGAVMSNL